MFKEHHIQTQHTYVSREYMLLGIMHHIVYIDVFVFHMKFDIYGHDGC
jgi:hypothetical protein